MVSNVRLCQLSEHVQKVGEDAYGRHRPQRLAVGGEVARWFAVVFLRRTPGSSQLSVGHDRTRYANASRRFLVTPVSEV